MALPMEMFADNEEQIQTTISSFAGWGESSGGLFATGRMMDTFLLDSGDLRTPGGTGKTFEWNKAVPMQRRCDRAA